MRSRLRVRRWMITCWLGRTAAVLFRPAQTPHQRFRVLEPRDRGTLSEQRQRRRGTQATWRISGCKMLWHALIRCRASCTGSAPSQRFEARLPTYPTPAVCLAWHHEGGGLVTGLLGIHTHTHTYNRQGLLVKKIRKKAAPPVKKSVARVLGLTCPRPVSPIRQLCITSLTVRAGLFLLRSLFCNGAAPAGFCSSRSLSCSSSRRSFQGSCCHCAHSIRTPVGIG
ncbi:uncharacterized protein K452DRAFT_26834 [Aplosporella prunicola CBS 121167]|uniref:Secreted protein n=1 Tax=Aplosporella prunicola CBS 121167 TaxID=1176127 RepID=A0A6A6BD85_9PEZI|nr:uncharacterized protein K452DRAFT_26834 [Aplosporella prunicola CBS 121167]KAF2142120.1 hypothetical protein K452DRAFT_26834 [Aplosporella prunicola CBS 121167]